VVCVGATDQNDGLATFSNYGADSVDLAAPGTNIYTTNYNTKPGYSQYRMVDGTSFATAYVSGTAALLWSVSPSSTVADVKADLLDGVDPEPALSGKVVTSGRLDAYNSLQLTQAR